MLNDRREEQKIIEVMQARILALGQKSSPESRLSHLWHHLRSGSFLGWNSVLSDPQLLSAIHVPHFPTAH